MVYVEHPSSVCYLSVYTDEFIDWRDLLYFSGNVTRNTFLQRASTVGYIGICRDHQLPSQVSNFVPVYPLIVPFLAEF